MWPAPQRRRRLHREAALTTGLSHTSASGQVRKEEAPEESNHAGSFPLGLRLLRGFRLGRPVEGNRLANESLEGGLVDFLSFADVDRAAHISVETRVEEMGRIFQRRALGE